MTKTLSIFFNIDRTYLTGVSILENGLSLDYIESTSHRVDLENQNSQETMNAVDELKRIFYEMDFKPNRLTVTIPAESIFVTKFPGKVSFTKDQFRQLVHLELRQAYPHFNYDDFSIKILPLLPDNSGKQMMIGIIYLNTDFNFISEIVKPLSLNIDSYEISQLSAHNSFMFNYPEMNSKTVAIIGIQGQFLDISVIKNGEPIYYNLCSVDNPNNIGNIFEKEYNIITEKYIQSLDACYFFGGGLNKQISMNLWETAMVLGIFEAKRLNPFRMMSTSLDKRHKEYCSRTFHIYPACIGGSLKPWHKVIEL